MSKFKAGDVALVVSYPKNCNGYSKDYIGCMVTIVSGPYSDEELLKIRAPYYEVRSPDNRQVFYSERVLFPPPPNNDLSQEYRSRKEVRV